MKIKIGDVFKSGFNDTVTLISLIMAFLISVLKNMDGIIKVVKALRTKLRYKKLRKKGSMNKKHKNR
jgi:hypothetical protein